jgi:hypothetical protein
LFVIGNGIDFNGKNREIGMRISEYGKKGDRQYDYENLFDIFKGVYPKFCTINREKD